MVQQDGVSRRTCQLWRVLKEGREAAKPPIAAGQNAFVLISRLGKKIGRSRGSVADMWGPILMWERWTAPAPARSASPFSWFRGGR
jgi:hypothetical protein